MERWTRRMIRFRWAVLGLWAVVLVVSLVATSGLADLLTNRFSLPGTDTHRAEQILEDQFGQKTTGSFTIVVAGRAGLGARRSSSPCGRPRRGPPPSCRPRRSSPCSRSRTRS